MAPPPITFSGISSGIDTASLINALIERERAVRVTPLEAKISDLTDTNDAFSQLKTLLNSFKSAADSFRVINGGVLSKIASSSDETVVSASASNSAQNATYSVTVNALAKNATLSLASSATTYTSSSDIINTNINNGDPNRTVSIQIGSGSEQETVNIDLTNTTTLDEFVTSFNSNTSKAVASVVNIGTSSSADYRVVITSNNTGVSAGQLSVSVGSEITDPDGNPGTTDGAFDSNTTSQATDANFSIAGIGTVSRSSNSISDVIPGLTFELKATGTASVTTAADAASSTATLQEFVDSYNELYSFIKENDLIVEEGEGEDTVNVFGPLALSSLDESLVSAIRSSFSSASKSGSLVNTLADLGITTERDGTLKFDATTFQSALSSESSSVQTITENLGEILASTDGTIAQFTRFNGLLDVSVNANKEQITDLEEKISTIESSLGQKEENLTGQFARLESLIGKLTSQQSAMLSLFPQ